jgi:hypothetical protein
MVVSRSSDSRYTMLRDARVITGADRFDRLGMDICVGAGTREPGSASISGGVTSLDLHVVVLEQSSVLFRFTYGLTYCGGIMRKE